MHTEKYKIIFWLNDLNLHLAPLIESTSYKRSVMVVANKEVLCERKKDGWDIIPNFGNAEILLTKDIKEINNLIKENLDAVHIFLGINGFKYVNLAFKYAVKFNVRIGIISESGIKLGIKGQFRKVKTIINKIRYSDKISFILPMGYLGEKWFENAYFDQTKLFPFLYVTENKITLNNIKINNIQNTTINILIVAQCIHRKNIKSILWALSNFNDYDWKLDIIGEGHLKESLIRLTEQLSISDKVTLHGTVSNTIIHTFFQKADFSILPSLWDGWGAVVNESLMCGTPVICSNKCGASCLIENSNRGAIYDVSNNDQLNQILLNYLKKGKLQIKERQEILNWSRKISKDHVSNYLLDVISYTYSRNKNSTKPVPSWV